MCSGTPLDQSHPEWVTSRFPHLTCRQQDDLLRRAETHTRQPVGMALSIIHLDVLYLLRGEVGALMPTSPTSTIFVVKDLSLGSGRLFGGWLCHSSDLDLGRTCAYLVFLLGEPRGAALSR